MKTLVCIGFAEALSAPEVAWSLVDAGFQVVTFARKGRRTALHHSHYVVPIEITPPEADCQAALVDLERLLVACSANAAERVLLPLDDAAVWLCSQLRHSGDWVLAGPRGWACDLALDKRIQLEAARSAGLNVPETTLARKADDVLAKGPTLPLILRPAHAAFFRNGQLHRGRNWICANQQELERAVSDWAAAYPVLVQPFIQGTGEGVFGLATHEGIQAWSAHRRLRMMNPHGSGSSACISQPVSSDLKPGVAEFIRQSEWRGLFMVELLRDQEGIAWFMEFNGRPWGSMALSRRQGLEYPAWTVKLALHPESRAAFPQAAKKPVVCRNIGRECMHVLFVLRGPKSTAIKNWPPFLPTLIDMVRVGEGHSLYNWRPDDRRVFFSDWWCTIRDQVFKSRN